MWVAEWLKTWDLRKLGNINKTSNLKNYSLVVSLPTKMNAFSVLTKSSAKIEIEHFLKYPIRGKN